MFDVEHDLALNEKGVVERQGVLGEVDGSLDRVLDRDHSHVDRSIGHGVEHVGHGAKGHQFASGQIGLRANGLFGEGAERPEEPDAGMS